MDAERSSLCNFVVNFLMEENYLLTAFELLHELLDDGRDAQTIRLKEFFSDPSRFPPDQISRYNSIQGLPIRRLSVCIVYLLSGEYVPHVVISPLLVGRVALRF